MQVANADCFTRSSFGFAGSTPVTSTEDTAEWSATGVEYQGFRKGRGSIPLSSASYPPSRIENIMAFLEGVVLFLASLVLGFVIALITGFFVWLLLGFTSIEALHIGYWDAFLITAAIGIATSKANVS